MKKFILAVLTILFTVLPSFSSDNGTLFKIFVLLWPISAILLAVLYTKWSNELFGIGKFNNKESKVKLEREKEEDMGHDNEETDEIKD